jgi:hypothetical protein
VESSVEGDEDTNRTGPSRAYQWAELMLRTFGLGSSGNQLWRIDPSNGKGVPMTRDLFNYADLGVSADGRSVVAVAMLGESTLWTAEADRLATWRR